MSNFNLKYKKSINNGQSVGYIWFEAMFTRLDIIVCNVSEVELQELGCLIQDKVHDLDNKMNRFDVRSEIAGVNNKAAQESVKISTELFDVIDYAIKAHEKTDGLFDITVHSLSGCKTGIRNIELSEVDNSIRFLNQNIRIDLGGIAKGYTVDCITKLLQEKGIVDFLISFGNSSIAAYGNQPSKNGWFVALQDGSKSFNLYNECLSISGNSIRNPEHIIHPKTGDYVTGNIQQAVVTYTAIEGEVLATIACIKGNAE